MRVQRRQSTQQMSHRKNKEIAKQSCKTHTTTNQRKDMKTKNVNHGNQTRAIAEHKSNNAPELNIMVQERK